MYEKPGHGPHSVNFPEREAAKLVECGMLRVDPDGSVWRLRRYVRNGGRATGQTETIDPPRRVGSQNKLGYWSLKVTLDDGDRTVCVHRLVWQLAHGDIPPKLTVNHKDGNPANNCIDNLELQTVSEQHLHRFRTLKQTPGAKRSRKLLERFVSAARQVLDTGDMGALREVLHDYEEWKGYTGPNARRQEALRQLSEAAQRRRE